MTVRDLLGGFESLGDNCEFGLVQRRAGLEPLGFFRFNFARLDALVRVLSAGFEGIGRREGLEIYAEKNGELMVRVSEYRFQYHTDRQAGSVDIETLCTQQARVLNFLGNKLMEDLRSGEKIMVRKGEDSVKRLDINRLFEAMRRIGPAPLLWVVPADQAHPAGLVELVDDGFCKGYIDRFAPYDDAPDFSPVWLDLCQGARNLLERRRLKGARIVPQTPQAGSNLIRHSADFAGSAWQTPGGVEAFVSAAVPRLQPACAAMQYTIVRPTDPATGAIHGHAIGPILSPGAQYTASVWVWLPKDFDGESVGVVFDGFASFTLRNANLGLREQWQRVWVTAQQPDGIRNANPSLFVLAPAGARLFSTCWKLEIGHTATAYQPPEENADAPPPHAAPAMALQRFRLLPVAEAEGQAVGELPPVRLTVPPLTFGPSAADPNTMPMLEWPGVPIVMLRNVVLHGQPGIVTQGDRVLAESAADVALAQSSGAIRVDEQTLLLPKAPLAANIHTAVHLLTADSFVWRRWLTGALGRFAADCVASLPADSVGGPPVVVMPMLDVFWKWESVAHLLEPGIARVSLGPSAEIFAQNLIYVPPQPDPDWPPHPAQFAVFDRMAAAYRGSAQPAVPWRRLYLPGPDAQADGDGTWQDLQAFGFTTLHPERLSVSEQIRQFAEATHVVAGPGADCTGLLFCLPRTVVCDILPSGPWARRVSVIRRLRYGVPDSRDGLPNLLRSRAFDLPPLSRPSTPPPPSAPRAPD